VGAVGLGTIITVLASTMAADVTGIVAASLIAALGFFIIPARRRKAKSELHERLISLRTNLVGSLTAEFEKEITRSIQRIEEAIAPYTRFVRSETERIEQVSHELKDAGLQIEQMRAVVEGWEE